jgi:hypothetical protein
MTNISNFDELAAVFRDSGLAHELEPDASAVKLPISKPPLEGVMFIRWQSDQRVLLLLQTLPFEIPAERMSAMALAIALLNHALVLPGFGLNAEARRCYFRFSMPFRPDGTLTQTEVQGLFNLAVQSAFEHLSALQSVAEGAEPETILDRG